MRGRPFFLPRPALRGPWPYYARTSRTCGELSYSHCLTDGVVRHWVSTCEISYPGQVKELRIEYGRTVLRACC